MSDLGITAAIVGSISFSCAFLVSVVCTLYVLFSDDRKSFNHPILTTVVCFAVNIGFLFVAIYILVLVSKA